MTDNAVTSFYSPCNKMICLYQGIKTEALFVSGLFIHATKQGAGFWVTDLVVPI